MKYVKKYEDGGDLYKIDAKTERRLARAARQSNRKRLRRARRYQQTYDEGTPSNPRFLMGAPNVSPEDYASGLSVIDRILLSLIGDERKPKIKNRGRAGGGMTSGGRRLLDKPVPPGC